MYKVVKRDGQIAEFNISKISSAITKAFDASGREYHPSVIDLLALKVTSDFEPKVKDGKIEDASFVGDGCAISQASASMMIDLIKGRSVEEARHLAPGEKERAYMESAMESLRSHYDEAVLLSFPGDELAMGGCMAAGREFFHINSHGGAEPCPFSPYSDINVKDTSLRDAIASPLFHQLQEQGILSGEHVGGCVLYEKRDQVAALASGSDG